MRYLLLCSLILLFGCKSGTEIVKTDASELIASFGKPISFEIKVLKDSGWTDWRTMDETDGENLLQLVSKCTIIEYNLSDRPSPSLPPPNWAVRCVFENGKSLDMEFLGSGSLIRMDLGATSEILEADKQCEKILELIDKA